ncbi:MAG: VanZ family protein [Agathobacter sp.]|nr:VanZ family protein [Agathobacter sp.]
MYFIDFDIFIFITSNIILFMLILLFSQKQTNEKKIWKCFFSFYILCLVKITIMPICLGKYPYSYKEYSPIQLIPFYTIAQQIKYGYFYQIVGNVILFIPLPIIYNHLFDSISRKKILIISILSAIIVEILQYIEYVITNYPGRVLDIDDIILNCAGIIFSVCFLKTYNRIWDKIIFWRNT